MQNAISVTRAAEKDNPEMSKQIQLRPALKGPVRRIASEHVMECYVVWNFAENKEGAKQFLADLVDNFSTAFNASEFYNFPCFQSTVPDMKARLNNDPKADPHDKYKILGDALSWTTNVGYPGYASAAIDEAFNTFVIPTMFASAIHRHPGMRGVWRRSWMRRRLRCWSRSPSKSARRRPAHCWR